MPYADVEQMTHRFDERTLKDLCRDDGTAETNLSSSDRMETALQDATAAIDMACQTGRMYLPVDLAALSGSDRHGLRRICCEITLSYLIQARPEKFKDADHPIHQRAEEYLDRLRKGERVFNIDANKNAGVVFHDGLSALDYKLYGNWIPDRLGGHFYPARSQRLPLGR
jgi:phage gp36-like protein